MPSEFKKLWSVLSRKEIWLSASSLTDHLCVIKIGSHSAFPGKIRAVSLEGVWVKLDQTKLEKALFLKTQNQLPVEVLGYLIVNEDRYYFVGQISNASDFKISELSLELFLPYRFEMFKLDRRSNFRVKLPESEFFEAVINEYENQACQIRTIVKDVSGGGVRLVCKDSEVFEGLRVDTKIKGSLKPTQEKTIQFEGVIRHFKRQNGYLEFGVMMIEDQIKSTYRLMSLTLTLRKKLMSLGG